MLLHTRIPKTFEASANVQYFNPSHDHYGITRSFDGLRAGASIGSASGAWSYRLDIDHLDSAGQPLSYFTTLRSTTAAAAADIPVTGAVGWTDQLGRAGYLFGINSEGLTDTVNYPLKFKLGFDVTATFQAALTVVNRRQRIDNGTGSILRDADADANTISSGAIANDPHANAMVRHARRHWSMSGCASGSRSDETPAYGASSVPASCPMNGR